MQWNFLSRHEKKSRVSRLENSNIPNCHLSLNAHFFSIFELCFSFDVVTDWRPEIETKCGLLPEKWDFSSIFPSSICISFHLSGNTLANETSVWTTGGKQLQKIVFLPSRPWAQFSDLPFPFNQRRNLAPEPSPGKTNQSNMANIVKYVAWRPLHLPPQFFRLFFAAQKLRRQYILRIKCKLRQKFVSAQLEKAEIILTFDIMEDGGGTSRPS